MYLAKVYLNIRLQLYVKFFIVITIGEESLYIQQDPPTLTDKGSSGQSLSHAM